MYDRSLFKGTAKYYSKYRHGFDQEVFDHIITTYSLDGKGRLLDLGCGTGQVALLLSGYFEEVVAIDIDADMLEEGEKIANEQGVKNIIWEEGRAEDISHALGMFRLITFGISFHWMNKELVLDRAYDIVEDGGGLAVINDISLVWQIHGEEPWKEKRREIIQKYLGEKRRAGNSFYEKSKKKFEDVLAESKFKDLEVWEFKYSRTLDIDTVIGILFTTSYANKFLLGDKAAAFEKEMREELLAIHPDNTFKEEGISQVMSVRK